MIINMQARKLIFLCFLFLGPAAASVEVAPEQAPSDEKCFRHGENMKNKVTSIVLKVGLSRSSCSLHAHTTFPH